MRRADGTWLTMVDHYSSYRTPLEATRAAVDELGPGQGLRDLAPGPVGEEHRHGEGRMAYVRKDASTLTRTERRRFTGALLEIKRSGEDDAFVRTHIEYFVSDGDGGPRA